MVLYTCEICNFSSKLKTDYKRHLKTKKHLHNIVNPLSAMVMNTNEHKMNTNEHKMNTNEHTFLKKNIKFQCNFCYHNFNTKASMRRHQTYYCKENMNALKIINEKNKIIKKLEKRVDKLIDKAGNTTTINNTIKINNYGDEDISHITDAFKTELLKIPYGAIPKMIEAIHFNDKKPENKNIFVPNLNKNIIKIMRNGKWIYKNRGDILLDMIDSKYLILDDHFNLILNGENIISNIKKNYTEFQNKYDDGNIGLLNNLKNDCEFIMLNHRNNKNNKKIKA